MVFCVVLSASGMHMGFNMSNQQRPSGPQVCIMFVSHWFSCICCPKASSHLHFWQASIVVLLCYTEMHLFWFCHLQCNCSNLIFDECKVSIVWWFLDSLSHGFLWLIRKLSSFWRSMYGKELTVALMYALPEHQSQETILDTYMVFAVSTQTDRTLHASSHCMDATVGIVSCKLG